MIQSRKCFAHGTTSLRHRVISCINSTFSTYYDSQSGLRIPVHNDKEISIFLDKRESNFVPQHLYKEDASSDMPDILKELRDQGIGGVVIPPVHFPRDLRNLQTLSAIAPPNFRFFTSIPSSMANGLGNTPPSNVSVLVGLQEDDSDVLLQEQSERGFHTMLSLQGILDDASAMSTASRVATILDQGRGGNLLWVSSPSTSVDADELVELCEELMYLDVAGPTIQSRLVVGAHNEDLVDEVMLAGVNKFVLADDFAKVEQVQEIAKWQGKAVV